MDRYLAQSTAQYANIAISMPEGLNGANDSSSGLLKTRIGTFNLGESSIVRRRDESRDMDGFTTITPRTLRANVGQWNDIKMMEFETGFVRINRRRSAAPLARSMRDSVWGYFGRTGADFIRGQSNGS